MAIQGGWGGGSSGRGPFGTAAGAPRRSPPIVNAASGRLSDLVLVRMHRRTAEYLGGDDAARAEIAAGSGGEATVGALAERILVRTIYAQASSRVGPLRELLQNALDVT